LRRTPRRAHAHTCMKFGIPVPRNVDLVCENKIYVLYHVYYVKGSGKRTASVNWNSIKGRRVLCINHTHLVVTCSFAQHTMFLDMHNKETLTHNCQHQNDRTVKGWDNYVLKDFHKPYIVRLNKCAMQLSNYCPVTTTCKSPSFQLPTPSALVTTFQY